MRFAAPQVLWALLALPLLAAAMWGAAVARRRALARFGGGAAYLARFTRETSPHRRAVKALALLVAVGFGVVAAARPQWGAGTETVSRKGIDLIILIDTSRSMAAQDVSPSRLARATREASLLLDALGGDRVGLVTFAGKPALVCPLTVDHEAVKLFLDELDTEAVSVPGTALADALAEAAKALGPGQAPGTEAKARAIVLLSDGEDHEGGIDQATRALRQSGIVVYGIGLGTDAGAPIPEADGAYKRDDAGKPVTTKLEEGPLRHLALETEGRYFRASTSEAEVEEIAQSLASLDAAGSTSVMKTRWVERYQIPLAIALVALLVDVALADRRRGA
ncbi:MAG TPA: VWA domain-containing protein [Candidatus Polarisedimenticolaceae bacterium]|nr:VWA domain-containing protein [Candidatus Polarisedimenticolaceae bacterium]